MIRLKREVITKTDMGGFLLVETQSMFQYDTYADKTEHSKIMFNIGFSAISQVSDNVGSESNPEYIHLVNYYKCEKIRGQYGI